MSSPFDDPDPVHAPAVLAVLPRHLAGAGDPAYVITPLHQAHGWTLVSPADSTAVELTSPQRDLALALTPDPNSDRFWWRITSTQPPFWTATFDALTPVEIISGVTDALHHPPADTVTAQAALNILATSSWTWVRSSNGWETGRSPDASLDLAIDPDFGTWFVTASLPGPEPRQRLWSATLAHTTPPHLLTGFTRALTDTAVVLRAPAAIPFRALHHLNVAETTDSPRRQLTYRTTTGKAALRATRRPTAPPPPGLATPSRRAH